MLSISKSIGNHVKLSALHGRLHLFSMGKVKWWIIKHIVLRIAAIHLVVCLIFGANMIVEYCESLSWPLMANSHIYILVWVNLLAGVGFLIGVVVLLLSIIVLVIIAIVGVGIKDF